jgi:hypothetical protein
MRLVKIPLASCVVMLSTFHEGQSGFLCDGRLHLNRGAERGEELVLDLLFDGKHDDGQAGLAL